MTPTTYRASFEYTGTGTAKPVQPKEYTVLGYGVKVVNSFYQGKMMYIDFQFLTGGTASNIDRTQTVVAVQRYSVGNGAINPVVQAIPLAAIALGLIVVAGLTALYFNFKEVHEIVESPQGSIFVLVLLIFAGVILWKQVKWS